MKNYIGLTLLITFVLLICSLGVLVTQSDSQPYVVLIRVLDEQGQIIRAGSGCFIRKDLVLTAGHIVQDGKRFEIVLPNGHIRPGYFEYQEDPNLTDVGFIRVHGDYPIGHFGKSAHIGQEVWLNGYALAVTPTTLTKGIVSCVDRDIDFFGKIHLFQIDNAGWPGHSGSPVLDNHNYIVGMLVGRLNGSDNWSTCVPIRIIRLVLAKYDAVRILESEGE